MALPPSGSVTFDRVAGLYDETRSLSPEATSRTVGLLREELIRRGRCLEIGVGTGRIALPLAARGIDMAGMDLSRPMLAKLIEKAGGHPPFPLVQADATALPFPDDSFGAGLAAHVLHLIRGWRGAVAELVRVVEPGGVILVNLGRWSPVLREVHERFASLAGASTRAVGLDHAERSLLDVELARARARARDLPPVFDERKLSIAEFVRQLESGVFSVTWSLDEQVRRRAAAAVRVWAEDRFGSLDEPRPFYAPLVWRAYDLP